MTEKSDKECFFRINFEVTLLSNYGFNMLFLKFLLQIYMFYVIYQRKFKNNFNFLFCIYECLNFKFFIKWIFYSQLLSYKDRYLFDKIIIHIFSILPNHNFYMIFPERLNILNQDYP